MLRLVVPAVIASFAGAITISRKPEYQADHYNFGQITDEAGTKDEDFIPSDIWESQGGFHTDDSGNNFDKGRD